MDLRERAEERLAHEDISRSYRKRRKEIESLALDLFRESALGSTGMARVRANNCITAAASFYEELDEMYPQ